MAVRSEPCELWATEAEVRECCPTVLPEMGIAWALRAATNLLWRLSGRQYGICTTTVRPCADCGCAGHLAAYDMMGGQSGWPGRAVDDCATCCACYGRCELPAVSLPSRPIQQVHEILIDGVPLPASAWRLVNARLWRVDGQTWPCSQNLAAETDQLDTFSIRYDYGTAVPEEGRMAARILACELIKSACGDKTCQLNNRIQQINRQDETLAFLDPNDAFDQGRTGIRIVDLFLTAVNPNGLRRRARAYDPQRLARFRG